MTHVVTGVLRRGGRALTSLGPATVAATVALIIAAAGFADAATGGNFLLGKTNTDNATSILSDSTGIPLALSAPSGKSPFSVNSTTQVNRLNAQYVGGDSASQLPLDRRRRDHRRGGRHRAAARHLRPCRQHRLPPGRGNLLRVGDSRP